MGPSGSDKSFFTNHMVRQYYEQGSHVLLVDTGNSYLGLCELINRKTQGTDGVYFTYTEQNPIAFNPFYTDDGLFDIEKRESIKTFILTLWKRDNEPPTRAEEVALSNAVSLYIDRLKDGIVPSFNTFYEFIRGEYSEVLETKKVREKDFDIANFLNVLEPYYKGGEYDYLLNSDKELDLLSKRFIVFELDNIKDHKTLFPIVTIIIMEVFINKMRFFFICLCVNSLSTHIKPIGNDLETSELLLSAAFFHCFQITHSYGKDRNSYANKQDEDAILTYSGRKEVMNEVRELARKILKEDFPHIRKHNVLADDKQKIGKTETNKEDRVKKKNPPSKKQLRPPHKKVV